MNNRKRQVILASLQLFTEKGYNNTSIQDILDAAHISKGTFYNYFSSKKDCLIAILEIGRSEAMTRKAELIIGKRTDDKDVLAVQIATSMQVNRERNLLSIFESIIHSGDKDLKKIVQDFHLKEMHWLSKRLIDVYTEAIIPYQYDATILLFGMTQQMLHVGHLARNERIEPIQAVRYAMKQIDVIIPSLIEKKDSFLGPELEQYIYEQIQQQLLTNEEIIEKLVGFRNGLESTTSVETLEYTDCLIEAFSADQPRYYLISTIAYQFMNSFRGTNHSLETIEIANDIWHITRTAKEENAKKKK